MIAEIPPTEYRQRQDAMRQWLAETRLSAAVVFDPASISYFSGFFFTPNERPIVLVTPVDADSLFLVPQIEQERAAACPSVGDVRVYREYPGQVHPMLTLVDVLQEKGLAATPIGVDHDGYLPIFGYRGPALSHLVDPGSLASVRERIAEQRMIKSAAEIQCLQESARWAAEGVNALIARLRAVRPGAAGALDLGLQASAEASAAMLRALGPGYTLRRPYQSMPVLVRLEIGVEGTRPAQEERQGAPGARVSATADVGGYAVELERTLFFGEPDEPGGRYFEAMLQLRATALSAVRRGRRARDVAADVGELARGLGVQNHIRHRCGHGLGLEPHERPFLDVGDATAMQTGMVLAIQPGLYVPGLGGFRHADTVAVTEGGIDVLTEYPSDLAALRIRT